MKGLVLIFHQVGITLSLNLMEVSAVAAASCVVFGDL
jgi:hypothetical protein